MNIDSERCGIPDTKEAAMAQRQLAEPVTKREVLAVFAQFRDTAMSARMLAWRITQLRHQHIDIEVPEVTTQRLRPVLASLVNTNILATVVNERGYHGPRDAGLRLVRDHLTAGATYYGLAEDVERARAAQRDCQTRIAQCHELLPKSIMLAERGWFQRGETTTAGTFRIELTPEQTVTLFATLLVTDPLVYQSNDTEEGHAYTVG
jgi:hypothetical protein